MGWIKKLGSKTLITLLILFLCLEAVSAATITVGPSGKDYTTINSAVTAASPNDIILVGDGIYNENIILSKENLTIISENGSSSAFIRPSLSSNHTFHVTASNTTIRGFNITGGGYYERAGIYALSVSNCTFSENQVNTNHYGIYLKSSSNNIIQNNNLSSNYYTGVYLDSSNNNVFTNNVANSNNYAGIFLMTSSSNNTFANNTVSFNYIGIQIGHLSDNNLLTNNTANSNTCYGTLLAGSSNITLINNGMSSNNYNFEVYGLDLEHFLHDIDHTNLVDGKPLYYWVNRANAVVPQDAGLVCLVNSTNITIRDIDVSAGYNGILLAYTNGSTVRNVITSGNYYGVHLISSNFNDFGNVTASNNGGAGFLLESSNNNRLNDSIASSNSDYGVYIRYSGNNVFNKITTNNNGKDGICLESSDDNTLTHNIASNNSGCGIRVSSSENSTLDSNVANSNSGTINEWYEIPEDPYGIYIYFSGNSTLSKNVANYNTNIGIYLRNSHNIELTENTVKGNAVYDFYDYYSASTIVDQLVLISDAAKISFVSDGSEIGIAGNDTSPVTLSGKRNVNGYVTIDSSGGMNVTFFYTDSGMSSAGESSIGLFRLNGIEWTEVTNKSLDTAGNYVYANLSEFGTFALFKNPESPVHSDSAGSSLAARIRSQGTITDLPLGENGQVISDTIVRSADSATALTLYEGTQAVDSYGNPVNRIIITVPASLPSGTPPELIRSGLYFDFGPSGTVFSQDVMITINFNPADFEGRTPVIYTYTSEEGWIALETTVDWETGRATAMISHFSLYALSVTDVEDTVVIAPASDAGLSAEVNSPHDNDSDSNHFYWSAGVGILLLLVLLIVISKNRQKNEEEL